MKLKEERIKSHKAQTVAVISSQESERRRYARDLHDGFGQMISIINMNMKSLEDTDDTEKIRSTISASAHVIEDMYKELRDICFDLMPQTLTNYGLANALEEFTYRLNQNGKKNFSLDIFGLDNLLDNDKEVAIYRVVQE